MFTAKVTLEQLKKIVSEAIFHLDYRQLWMITWIDKIDVNPSGYPYFIAAVHQVISDRPSDSSFDLSKLDLKKPRTVALPLRLLRLFPVGTLFSNGVTLFKAHERYIPNYILDIDTSQGLVRTKLKHWIHGPALISAMSFSKLNTASSGRTKSELASESNVSIYDNRATKSKIANFDYILFQGIELARFYWFPSTKLFHAFMDGAAASNLQSELYVSEDTFVKTVDGKDYHQVIISDSMYLRDAPFIARIAFDTEALSSANTIYQSVVRNRSMFFKVPLHLDCTFPFIDKTTLKVNGYTIQVDSVTILIVTEINQCYGPWPFKSLKFDRETPRAVVDPNLEKMGTEKRPIESPDVSAEDEYDVEDELAEIVFHYNPRLKNGFGFDSSKKNNNRVGNAEYSESIDRFPTLTKDRERLDRIRLVNPKNLRDTPTIPIDNISMNENKQSGGRSTNLDIVTSELVKEVEIDTEQFIIKLCKEFRDVGAVVQCVTLTGDSIYSDEIVPIEIPLPDGKHLYAYFLRVQFATKDFFICEFENRVGTSLKIIIRTEMIQMDEASERNEVEELVKAIGKNHTLLGGVPKDKYTVSRINHIEETEPKGYRDRILVKVGLSGFLN